jgi:hypothetical protein
MAGVTAPLAFPYPTGTDRVMDGDNAIQALAEKVDDFLAPLGNTVPVATVISQNGWNTSLTYLMKMGPLVVMRLDAVKASWAASEGIGQVPVEYRPRLNVFACAVTGATGSPTSFYVRGGDGVIVTVLAASGGAGLSGSIVWSMG